MGSFLIVTLRLSVRSAFFLGLAHGRVVRALLIVALRCVVRAFLIVAQGRVV